MRNLLILIGLIISVSVEIDAAGSGRVSSRPRLFRNVITGLCLNADIDDDSVVAAICDREADQRWELTSANEVKSVSNSMCLTSSDDGRVFTSECNADSNQQWSFRNGQVKNEATGKCVEIDGNFNAAGAACLNADYQKWYISFSNNDPKNN